MLLGKLSVPGLPANLDSRARATTPALGAGGVVRTIFSYLSFLFTFSLSGRETKILSQRAVKPKTTNQPKSVFVFSELKSLYSRISVA